MHPDTWKEFIETTVSDRYILRSLVYADFHQAEFLAAVVENEQTTVSIALVEPEPGKIEPDLTAITRAKELQHPHLLQVMDGGECLLGDAKMLFIVTEAVQGTLATAPRPDLSILLGDLLEPLDWLHAQNLVYRNLDRETVVLADGHWKLADLSQVHPSGQFEEEKSSGPRVPPEAAAGWVLPAWDIWTIGVLLRDMLGGDGTGLSAPFDTIVPGCLRTDQRRRLSSAEIRELLTPALASEEPVVSRAAVVPISTKPSRSRVGIMALAATAILGGALVALFTSHRGTAPARVIPPPRAAAPLQSDNRPAPAEKPRPAAAKVPRVATTPAPQAAAPKASVAAGEQVGRADYFSDGLEGNRTASGEAFSNNAMTAASPQFPLGARLRVTDLQSKRSVMVRVNDRGPTRRGFVVTVTRRAAEELGFVKAGSAHVKVELVN